MKRALPSSLAKETFMSKLGSRLWIFIFRVIRILFRSFLCRNIVIVFRVLKFDFEFDYQKDLEINFNDGAIADQDEILVEIFYIKMSQWVFRPSAGKVVYVNQHVLKTTNCGRLLIKNAINRVSKGQTWRYVTVYSRILPTESAKYSILTSKTYQADNFISWIQNS